MTRGAYLLSGHDGPYAVERFSSGAGPAGWRYVATRHRPTSRGGGAPTGRLDVVLDAGGVAVRVHVEAGGWLLRGGTVGSDVLWRRGDRERVEPAAGFTGTSPVWALSAARRAAPAPVRLRLVHLGDEALGTRMVEQAWSPGEVQERDGIEVRSFTAGDLATGEHRTWHLAADLVLSAPGVELLEVAD